MSDVMGTLRKLFPSVRVTSAFRGPNHPLTRKNPRSYHAQGSPDDPRAFDVAPLPGVGFDQFVGKLKGSGLNIAEALDEAKNPSRNATGPHWHIGLGDKKAVPQSNYGSYGRPRLPMDLEQRAASFGQGMIPPPERPYYPEQPQMAPQQPIATEQLLGGLAMPEKKPETGLFKGNDIAAVLGILGDGLMAYGGLQPQFGPGVRQREAKEQEQAYDREKFNAELQMKRQERLAKAQEPPAFVQNARVLAQLPPEELANVARYQDLMNPTTADVQDADGRVVRQLMPRIERKEINGQRYFKVGGEWYLDGGR